MVNSWSAVGVTGRRSPDCVCWTPRGFLPRTWLSWSAGAQPPFAEGRTPYEVACLVCGLDVPECGGINGSCTHHVHTLAVLLSTYTSTI